MKPRARMVGLCGGVVLLIGVSGFATREVSAHCIIGVTGTRASVTVHGWGASHMCEAQVKAGNGRLYLRNEPPTEPVLCEIAKHHQRYVVRDEGLFVVVGRMLCATVAQSDDRTSATSEHQILSPSAPVGFVNDFAGVIPADRRVMIAQLTREVRAQTPGDIAVVTLKEIGRRDVADVARELGRQWEAKEISNSRNSMHHAGVVILVIPKETSVDGMGHCWIATVRGDGWGITDADAGDICREATPFFRQRSYGDALTLVTYRVAQRFAQRFHFTLDTAPPRLGK